LSNILVDALLAVSRVLRDRVGNLDSWAIRFLARRGTRVQSKPPDVLFPIPEDGSRQARVQIGRDRGRPCSRARPHNQTV
jgi:hypothetical protein